MIITRFAPSPTGYLHFGNIRTALFTWLFARKNSGIFYLRIDDTDRDRSLIKYVNNILDTLKWLNINFDGKLIFQSKNLNIYKNFLDILLTNGYAYKCFCSKDRLSELKKKQVKNKLKIEYDGFCKNKQTFNLNSYIIRFNNKFSGCIKFNDLVKGEILFNNNEFDDFIIAKENYFPTYNFASVVDDIYYNVSHIIRGDDHVSNTAKQINLINAFGKIVPKFAHLPMILDEKKNVLSKRDNRLYINYYRDNGFLPEAILNYIVKLGWAYKDKEIFSINEMINLFSFKNVSQSASCINYDKLVWLNKYYIKVSSFEHLFKHFLNIEKKFKLNYLVGPSIKKLISFYRFRVNNLKELILDNLSLYVDDIFIDLNNCSFFLSLDNKIIILKFFNFLKYEKFFWSLNNIKYYINLFISFNDIFIKDFFSILRLIIRGSLSSISVYETLFLSGRILILKKIKNIIKSITK